jgi:hypothetical protein
MATARSLAEGHKKLTILTTKPANVLAPTVTELNAGIDASCAILESDFTWTAADSDKVAEKALCTTNNANALGASNFNLGVTLFRYFDTTTKNPDATADAAFVALAVKGVTVWGYLRNNAKLSTQAWAAGDVMELGGEAIADAFQSPGNDGFIKARVPLEAQNMVQNIVLA